ncbi:hypothetical protein PsorP6_007081 [Peronosclerospora sorghi]|uniref:Uncharacterized protein n=1 Tax=Peronosclerospora sorghi TaxID=230839 RepID=A0ACC0W811_9STRA|nr:hypothetical protein PsorP6_007081 [Peronosclerospora sorghi]
MRATLILSPLMTSLLASFAGTIDANGQSLEHTGVRRLRVEAGGESGRVASKLAEDEKFKYLVEESNKETADYIFEEVKKLREKMEADTNARLLHGDQTKVDDEVEKKS